jgi:hypothetical protein
MPAARTQRDAYDVEPSSCHGVSHGLERVSTLVGSHTTSPSKKPTMNPENAQIAYAMIAADFVISTSCIMVPTLVIGELINLSVGRSRWPLGFRPEHAPAPPRP